MKTVLTIKVPTMSDARKALDKLNAQRQQATELRALRKAVKRAEVQRLNDEALRIIRERRS